MTISHKYRIVIYTVLGVHVRVQIIYTAHRAAISLVYSSCAFPMSELDIHSFCVWVSHNARFSFLPVRLPLLARRTPQDRHHSTEPMTRAVPSEGVLSPRWSFYSRPTDDEVIIIFCPQAAISPAEIIIPRAAVPPSLDLVYSHLCYGRSLTQETIISSIAVRWLPRLRFCFSFVLECRLLCC